MAKSKAAQTRKPHKTRKNVGLTPGGGSSSTALATRQPSPPPTTDKPEDTPIQSDGKGGVMIDTGIPQEVEPKKQNWYRPPDSKARKWVEKILVMREAGRGDAEIAKLLKMSEASVRQYIWLGKKNGWLNAEGEIQDLEAELALNIDRKIVRNISAVLDGRMTNYQTHEMTVAAAKGRGIFKNHDKSESTSQQMSIVAIRIEHAPLAAGQQEVIEANVGGVPAYLEGEVADGESN